MSNNMVVTEAETGARPRSPEELYQRHFRDTRRERMFLASVAFAITFFVVRAITHAIHHGVGPFHNLEVGGFHLHHLVWGILLLLLVGYLWLAQIGTGVGDSSTWASRITASLFGMAAALTLDEFALWLHLQDVYWAHEGRQSIDAVMLFGALLSIVFWGGPFFHGLVRESVRAIRH